MRDRFISRIISIGTGNTLLEIFNADLSMLSYNTKIVSTLVYAALSASKRNLNFPETPSIVLDMDNLPLKTYPGRPYLSGYNRMRQSCAVHHVS